jgi:hypothetical protein
MQEEKIEVKYEKYVESNRKKGEINKKKESKTERKKEDILNVRCIPKCHNLRS